MRINPWSQQARLATSDAAGGDNVGVSLAVSGETAVVGAPGKDGSAGAAYIFVYNGTRWSQQARLTGGTGVAGDEFGLSVAVSGDTAVIGAPFMNTQAGAAYVFVRHGANWSQQAKLTAGDAAPVDDFGYSVALSGDTAVVGAPQKNDNSGAAYVFVRHGANWSQQAKLTARDAAPVDDFGYSVALDGNRALVGAPQKNSSRGAAYVFARRGAAWRQQAKLSAGDGAANDELGTSVAFSGGTAVVGAPGKNSAAGAAYVFVPGRTGWRQQARLVAGPAQADDNVGFSVAISGNTALIGAPGNKGNAGVAYAFVRSGPRWAQQSSMSVTAAANDEFGTAVALNGDTALIGVPGKNNGTGVVYVLTRGATRWSQRPGPAADDLAAGDQFGFSMAAGGAGTVVGAPGKNGAGAAYVFVPGGAGWLQQAQLAAGDGALRDRFGFSVALGDNSAAIGAPGRHSGTGAVYVFVPGGTTWRQQAELRAGDGAAGDQFGFSVALGGDIALVGAPDRKAGIGAAYVFERQGATWRQQAELRAGDGAAGDQFGFSVALGGNTVLVGAPGKDTGTGAAYVFERRGTSWFRQAELVAGDSLPGDELGTAVGLSGYTALVGAGAPFNTHTGAAYVFERHGASWRQQAKLVASDGAARDQFGLSVALSGNTALIGAPFNTHTGAAYVFERRGASWRQQAKLVAGDGGAHDRFGLFVALSRSIGLVGAPGKNNGTGGVYMFARASPAAP